MKKLNFSFLSLLVLCLSCSSSDDDDNNNATDKAKEYPVHFSLNTNPAQEDNYLGSYPDKAKEFHEPRIDTDQIGYKGLFVYSDKDKNLLAYDMACPNCWNGSKLVEFKDPGYRYECKSCGLKAYLDNGFGTFENKKGIVYLVKYPVTEVEKGIYLIANPK